MWQAVTDVIQSAPPPPIPGDDRITMLLTAVGVIAAFGGLMLGVAAGYVAYLGYRTKKDLEKEAGKIARKIARTVAAKIAKEAAEKYLEESGTVPGLYAERTKEPAIPVEALASNEGEGGQEEDEDADDKLG